MIFLNSIEKRTRKTRNTQINTLSIVCLCVWCIEKCVYLQIKTTVMFKCAILSGCNTIYELFIIYRKSLHCRRAKDGNQINGETKKQQKQNEKKWREWEIKTDSLPFEFWFLFLQHPLFAHNVFRQSAFLFPICSSNRTNFPFDWILWLDFRVSIRSFLYPFSPLI